MTDNPRNWYGRCSAPSFACRIFCLVHLAWPTPHICLMVSESDHFKPKETEAKDGPPDDVEHQGGMH